eukprot:7118158-Prymnesium_polylepis.1
MPRRSAPPPPKDILNVLASFNVRRAPPTIKPMLSWGWERRENWPGLERTDAPMLVALAANRASWSATSIDDPLVDAPCHAIDGLKQLAAAGGPLVLDVGAVQKLVGLVLVKPTYEDTAEPMDQPVGLEVSSALVEILGSTCVCRTIEQVLVALPMNARS